MEKFSSAGTLSVGDVIRAKVERGPSDKLVTKHSDIHVTGSLEHAGESVHIRITAIEDEITKGRMSDFEDSCSSNHSSSSSNGEAADWKGPNKNELLSRDL